MNQIDILIIEDNPADILLIKEYLGEEEKYRFNCREAETLKAALELIPHYDFDAILLDLKLPDSSGLDTVRRIVTSLPETAVIILTGLQDDELALQAVGYGAQDFLEKRQLSPTALSKSIRYAIERKKSLQDKEDLLNDLHLALERIEQLENLLPICSFCRKMLGNDGRWYRLEEMPVDISPNQDSDLICPQCHTNVELTPNASPRN